MTNNIFFMKIIRREGCFMGLYVRLHFLILCLFPSKEWLLFAYALSFCRLLGAILFLLDGIIRCNQFTYSVRMSLMGECL